MPLPCLIPEPHLKSYNLHVTDLAQHPCPPFLSPQNPPATRADLSKGEDLILILLAMFITCVFDRSWNHCGQLSQLRNRELIMTPNYLEKSGESGSARGS